MRPAVKRVAVTAAIGVALLVGGPWVYINVIRDDAPARLQLTSTTTGGSDSAPIVTANGQWTVRPGSVVGYRVKEILFGQDTEGVGRTSNVVGTLSVEDSTLTSAEFSVDMTTLESDDGRRDGQFRGRIMDTSTFPTSTFTLTQEIEIPAEALTGTPLTTTAVGTLTLRGQTKTVEVPIEALLNKAAIEVVGTVRIVFAEWGIPNPSRPGISTADYGDLEFQLTFEQS